MHGSYPRANKELLKSNSILEEANESSTSKIMELTENISSQEKNIAVLECQVELLENNSSELKDKNNKLEQTLNKQDRETAGLLKQSYSQEATIKLLNEQIIKIKSKTQLLESEKWELGQEKAILQNQIKLYQEAI